MNKFKLFCNKASSILELLIGLSLAVCLFAGGLGFIGYIIAFCIGGQTATEICTWIYENYYGTLIKVATYTTLATFLLIYLKGEAKWVNPIKAWTKKPSKDN